MCHVHHKTVLISYVRVNREVQLSVGISGGNKSNMQLEMKNVISTSFFQREMVLVKIIFLLSGEIGLTCLPVSYSSFI